MIVLANLIDFFDFTVGRTHYNHSANRADALDNHFENSHCFPDSELVNSHAPIARCNIFPNLITLSCKSIDKIIASNNLDDCFGNDCKLIYLQVKKFGQIVYGDTLFKGDMFVGSILFILTNKLITEPLQLLFDSLVCH